MRQLLSSQAPRLPSCRWMELLEEAVQNATRRPGAAPTPAHPPPPGPQGPANQSPRPHRCLSSRPLPSPASHSLAAALCPHLWAHLRLPPVCCAQEPLPAVMATTLNVGRGQNRDGRGLVGTHLCAGCQQGLKPGPSWTLHLHCPFSVGRVGFHNLFASWLAESQRSQQVTCHRLSPPGQNWMTQKCSTVNQSLRGCLEVRVWSPPDRLLLLPQHPHFLTHVTLCLALALNRSSSARVYALLPEVCPEPGQGLAVVGAQYSLDRTGQAPNP